MNKSRLNFLERECSYCKTIFKPYSKINRFCSVICSRKESQQRNGQIFRQQFKIKRQNLKRRCIEYKGGMCEKCGYNKHPCAFDFHHIDKNTKDYDITKLIRNNNWKLIKKELDKCQLLCATCHREEEFKIYEH
jgi:hypothetical protein